MTKTAAFSAGQKSILTEITKGTVAAFENAERLFFEAAILHKARAYSRALFLHQISMEELAKVEALGALASGLLMGANIDLSKATKNLTHHKAKNYINAYMLARSEEEKMASRKGDVPASLKAFEATQAAFHQESNDAKNAALYVDLVGDTFVSPAERVTKDMVQQMAQQNKEFLGLMAPKRDMMVKWNAEPEAVIPLMNTLKETMVRLKRDYKDDPAKIPDLIMEALLQTIPEEKRPKGRK